MGTLGVRQGTHEYRGLHVTYCNHYPQTLSELALGVSSIRRAHDLVRGPIMIEQPNVWITEYVEENPARPRPSYARLKESGTAIWAFIEYLQNAVGRCRADRRKSTPWCN